MSFDGVLLTDMAMALGRDRSTMRRWLREQGFTFHRVRDPLSQQSAYALTANDARAAIERRRQLGWSAVTEDDLRVQELWLIRE